jgi:superfamily I DNA and RNA helicase
MINVVWGSTKKKMTAKALAAFFESYDDASGTLYIGYPVMGGPDGPFPIDALLLSPELGAVVFHLVEGRSLGDYWDAQDEGYAKLQAKLLPYRVLLKGRELAGPIHALTFAPAITNLTGKQKRGYRLANNQNLRSVIDRLLVIPGRKGSWGSSYADLVQALQSISTIRRGRQKRSTQIADSRGSKLKALEDSISNLDTQQSRAVIETVAGVQRIRGLAGSGKTIVLALKVAYLHAQNPDWQIAVTFNTRALKGQFEHLINNFVVDQISEEPDWTKIRVINAWGASGGALQEGVYYDFCRVHEVEYLDFRKAKAMWGANDAFQGACEKAIADTKKFRPKYDVILVDEAQDFSPSFLRLCYEFVKEPKRLIYAYDELQSLTSNFLPAPEELFGADANTGKPRVVFKTHQSGQPRQDIILDRCYRNSRPVLSTAHALGFGIYRKPDGLIQMFDQKSLWLDVGYRVAEGALEEGEHVTLSRTEETSPLFLEEHSDIDDLLVFKRFETNEEQTDWLVSSITKNLGDDELRPDDIIVINPDPLTTRDAVASARDKLFAAGINSSLAGVTSSPDVFYQSDSVTFTGIFRAKGNEAGMVYVINAHECFTGWRGTLARKRNQLFTAITRSKAWVRVVGVGPQMDDLIKEFRRIKKNEFQLSFEYPDAATRKQLNIVNRDISAAEQKEIRKNEANMVEILQSLERGDTMVEDYPKEVIQRLRNILGNA